MNYIVITIYFLQFCCQVILASLPAPVNVTVESFNFEHNLWWDPGPGTPPGTSYRVKYSPCRNKSVILHVPDCSVAVVKQTLQNCTRDVYEQYTIQVRAVHRGRKSNWSIEKFTPFTDTLLGPPEVSVSGCGDCLNVTITLPRGKAELSISEIYHVFIYRIFWKSAGDSRVWNINTANNRRVLPYLEQGLKYCVQVEFHHNTNKHSLPSGWVCAFTSPGRQSPALIAILASVSGLLLLGGLVLMGLIYAGVLCQLKTHLPRVILLVESNSYHCFTVAEATPNPVTCDAWGREKGGGAVAQQLRDGSDEGEEEEEEEEEEEGSNGYENRMARFLEDSSSGTASQNTTGSLSTAVTELSAGESCGSSGTAGEEPHWTEPRREDGIFGLSEGNREQQKTLGETEDGDTGPGMDVNLLSVMLGGPGGQGVAEQTGELWGWQPALSSTGSGDAPARLGGALSNTQNDSPELLHTDSLLTLSDCGQSDAHYVHTHTNWKEEVTEGEERVEGEEEEAEEEEEENEECSGYMRR